MALGGRGIGRSRKHPWGPRHGARFDDAQSFPAEYPLGWWHVIGRAAYIGTAIFVVAGIFEILDIASEIVIWAFILVFGALCLALALAFGLGGREVAGRFLEKWLEQKKNE